MEKQLIGNSYRFIDTKELYEYGFNNYSIKTIVKQNDVLKQIEIKNSTNETKILDSLLEQEKEPILLVDNDKAGEAIIKTVSENAEKYQRITLVTISGKITTIVIKDNKYVPQTDDLLNTKEFEGLTTIENLLDSSLFNSILFFCNNYIRNLGIVQIKRCRDYCQILL